MHTVKLTVKFPTNKESWALSRGQTPDKEQHYIYMHYKVHWSFTQLVRFSDLNLSSIWRRSLLFWSTHTAPVSYSTSRLSSQLPCNDWQGLAVMCTASQSHCQWWQAETQCSALELFHYNYWQFLHRPGNTYRYNSLGRGQCLFCLLFQLCSYYHYRLRVVAVQELIKWHIIEEICY